MFVQIDLSDNKLCGVKVASPTKILGEGNYVLEGIQAIANAIAVSRSLMECTLLRNHFDVETATMLAKISKDRRISLCAIASEQTEADFKNQGLQPADAILIAASIVFRDELIQVFQTHDPRASRKLSVHTLCFRRSICQGTACAALTCMAEAPTRWRE